MATKPLFTSLRRCPGADAAILLIHGFNADTSRTWGLLPQLLSTTPALDGCDRRLAARSAQSRSTLLQGQKLPHRLTLRTAFACWMATTSPPVIPTATPKAHQANTSARCRVNRRSFMPVPSSNGSVLQQASHWALVQVQRHPDLVAVGVFGSYGRGTAAVGSDLDLLLILKTCDQPIWDRLRRWDTGSLPQ